MLTYADLQMIQRNERASVPLQKIDDNLFSDYNKAFSVLPKEYQGHFRALMDDILERRKNKMLRHLMDAEPSLPANLTKAEKKIYEEILGALKVYMGQAVNEAPPAEKSKPSEKPKQTESAESDGKTTVRFISAFPAIIGADSKHYGPFAEGDIVELPLENASLLVEHGAAEKV
ncbi:MAG: hypothetical protein MSIBF_04735 [Candidatus Altiarchaeales archaeon IMC4]|nr:MAG: hypothetical protein MSIBF_04735 [Candidatus Altiarchaeales archaeon IMC4]